MGLLVCHIHWKSAAENRLGKPGFRAVRKVQSFGELYLAETGIELGLAP